MATRSLDLLTRIKALAASAGVGAVGVAPPVLPPDDVARLRQWLQSGQHAGMQWMAESLAERSHPRSVFHAVRSVIVCVFPLETPEIETPFPRVARFAWGVDYHRRIRAILGAILDTIQAEDSSIHGRVVVDTAPLMERALAVQAGLGVIGWNNCLIHPDFGSNVLLGEILLDVDLSSKREVAPAQCHQCGKCLAVCPSGALKAPYTLDARRCISWWTIENRAVIPRALAETMGGWAFGCDLCQRVCPHNRGCRCVPNRDASSSNGLPASDRTIVSGDVEHCASDPGCVPSTDGVLRWSPLDEPPVLDIPALAELSRRAFDRRYRLSALHRAGQAGLLRNLIAAEYSLSRRSCPVPSLGTRFSLLQQQWSELSHEKSESSDRDEIEERI